MISQRKYSLKQNGMCCVVIYIQGGSKVPAHPNVMIS